MLEILAQKGRLQWVAAFIVLATVAAFAYTGSFVVLAVPFGFLFVTLLVLNWKSAWWLFLFSVVVSVQVSFFHDTLSTSLPDEPLMWLFLLTFLVLFATNPNRMPEWWWRNPLTLIMVLQFLWLIVAVICSKELFISVKFLAAKSWFLIAYAIFPILVFRKKKDFKRAFLLLLIPMVITMIIIVYRHSQKSFGYLLINRAVGILYFNRVDYATIMSMFFPLLLVAVPLSAKLKPWYRWILYILILFYLAAIYLTFARGAMMALVFCLFIGFAIRKKFVQFIMPGFYAVIIAAVMFMVQHNKFMDFRPDYDHTYTHFTFTDHLIATFRGTDMSSMERLYRWIAGARMSMDRPLTGYGPNAFYFYYKAYAVSSFRTYVSRNPEQSTTHNYFLFMLVEQGWPAMILYGLLVAAYFVQAQKVYHRFKDRFYKYCTLGIAMLFAASFINNFFSELLETHKVGCLFYLSIALLIILNRKSKLEEAGLLEESEGESPAQPVA